MTPKVIRTETIRYWLDQLEAHFRPLIVQRGYEEAEKGNVSSLFLEEGMLRAYVQGSKKQVYVVKLDLEYFGISSCSCSKEGYCKHMSAVIFKACQYAGLNMDAVVEELLNPADPLRRSRLKSSGVGESERLKRELGHQNPKQIRTIKGSDTIQAEHHPHDEDQRVRPTTRKSGLEQDASAEVWQRWLMSQVKSSSTGGMLASTRASVLRAVDHVTAQWEEQPAILMQLYAEIVLMQLTDELARKFDVLYNVSHNGPSIERLILEGMQQIDELVERIDSHHLHQSHPEHIRLLKDALGNQPYDMSMANINWLEIYRLLWWRVLCMPDLVRDEQQRLHEMLKNDRMIAQKKELVQCGVLHFLLMNGEDLRVQKEISTLRIYGAPEWWLFYLDQFWHQHEWTRLIHWLQWLLPHIQSVQAGSDLLTAYLELWKRAAAQVDCEEEWREALLRLLPASFFAYEEFLIERGQYRMWADLMMSLGIQYEQIRQTSLQQVEAHDPQMLLPIMHQAVEQQIAKKNKESYRSAARLLKTIKHIYGKLAREDIWQEFIVQLDRRYSRLRSLQAALKKEGLRL